MEQNKCKNNAVSYKKIFKSLMKDFIEKITQYGFKYRKKLIKKLKNTLRSDKKAANDENEDDNEYLQGIIGRLNRLKSSILEKINIIVAIQNIEKLKLLDIYLMKLKIIS